MIERPRLTDAQWERIAPLVPGKEGDPGRHGEDNRKFVEGVLWIGRTGVPWRSAGGIWRVELRFSALFALGKERRVVPHPGAGERGPRSRKRHHRRDDRAGAPALSRRKRGAEAQAIGRSRGGPTTKIHIAVDALGNPLRLILTPGQVHDSTQAEALIDGLVPEHVIADKADDIDRIRAYLAFRAEAVIPPKINRSQPITYDEQLH